MVIYVRKNSVGYYIKKENIDILDVVVFSQGVFFQIFSKVVVEFFGINFFNVLMQR